MKRALVVLTIATVALTACSGKDKGKEGEGGATCGPAPSPLTDLSKLPGGFPAPKGFVVTGIKTLGPSLEVDGYRKGDLDSAYDGVKKAFSSGGYSVTDSEKEEGDAEVAFSGNNTTGQVKLKVECADRTTMTITIRPAV